jgi:hypothetical protein
MTAANSAVTCDRYETRDETDFVCSRGEEETAHIPLGQEEATFCGSKYFE